MRILKAVAKTLLPLILSAFLSGPARSQTADAELRDYFAAKEDAYRFYRSAWSYLRTGNAGLAAMELGFFLQAWEELRSRFATAPPGPFAGDPRWREGLADVARMAAAGLAALEAADTDDAKAALAPIPRVMAEIRARNGVVTLSDAVDALTRAMDGLWRYRRESPDFENRATAADLEAGIERLRAAVEQMRDQAPDEVAFDDQFLRLVDGSDAAVGRLEDAVQARDRNGLVNALRELRSFERLIWLNFG